MKLVAVLKPRAARFGNGSIGLWNVATGRELARLAGHERAVNSVAFSPDGKTLASGSSEKSVRLWEVEAQRLAGLLAASDDDQWFGCRRDNGRCLRMDKGSLLVQYDAGCLYEASKIPSVTSPNRSVTFPNSAVTIPKRSVTMDRNTQGSITPMVVVNFSSGYFG